MHIDFFVTASTTEADSFQPPKQPLDTCPDPSKLARDGLAMALATNDYERGHWGGRRLAKERRSSLHALDKAEAQISAVPYLELKDIAFPRRTCCMA